MDIDSIRAIVDRTTATGGATRLADVAEGTPVYDGPIVRGWWTQHVSKTGSNPVQVVPTFDETWWKKAEAVAAARLTHFLSAHYAMEGY